MVAVKLQGFGGMLPAVDTHLLPQNAAEESVNTWLSSGAIQGFPEPDLVYTPVSSGTQRVFRIPINKVDAARIANSYWLEFSTPNVTVIQSPTIADSFERFYWASDAEIPKYNTKARIALGSSPYILGVPRPPVAPSVAVAGGSGIEESRAYVYTWVTIFGEESAPSPPRLHTGYINGVWELGFTAPGGSITDDRALEYIRIYRTVSGVGGQTDYFFVAEISVAEADYDDTIESVTTNNLLRSLFWEPPPTDLQGFVSLPNGMIAGWRGSEIWFCEPYRPHAWPPVYQISVESKIIGCGSIGQTLIVCTEGAPFAITGINPSSMAVSRLSTLEPCTSRGSIVSTPAGVVYTSPNGLCLASPGGSVVITRQMISRDLWDEFLALETIFGGIFDGAYYCFGSTAIGCFEETAFDNDSFLQQDFTGSFTGACIHPTDARIAYSILKSPSPVISVYPDTWTGEIFVHRNDGVYWINQNTLRPKVNYLWKSKVLESPEGKNFAVMKVYFNTFPATPELNPVPVTDADFELGPDQYGLVRLYADGVLRFTREIRKSGELFRLPSGFKATFWQVEIESRVKVNSVELATASADLSSV